MAKAGMKEISLKEVPKKINGQVFRILDPDARSTPIIYKCDNCGAEIPIEMPQFIEGANLVQLLKQLLIQAKGAVTDQDSSNAFDLMQLIASTPAGAESVKLTDGIHSWILNFAKRFGPGVFGINSHAVVKALENVEKTGKGE